MSAPLMALVSITDVRCCLLTNTGLFDSLSFLLEMSMSVYVEKWYLLPQGY